MLHSLCQQARPSRWLVLVEESSSLVLTAMGAQAAIRRRRRNRGDDVHKRADRALKLVQMGELSAGRSSGIRSL